MWAEFRAEPHAGAVDGKSTRGTIEVPSKFSIDVHLAVRYSSGVMCIVAIPDVYVKTARCPVLTLTQGCEYSRLLLYSSAAAALPVHTHTAKLWSNHQCSSKITGVFRMVLSPPRRTETLHVVQVRKGCARGRLLFARPRVSGQSRRLAACRSPAAGKGNYRERKIPPRSRAISEREVTSCRFCHGVARSFFRRHVSPSGSYAQMPRMAFKSETFT